MSPITTITIGYRNYINPGFVKEILEPNHARGKKAKAWALENSRFIDATAGRKARCILYMTTGHVILCGINCRLIRERIMGKIGIGLAV